MHNMHTYYAYVYELVVHTLVQQVFVIPSGSKTSYRSILMYRTGTHVLLELTIAHTEKVKVGSNFFSAHYNYGIGNVQYVLVLLCKPLARN